MTEDMNKVTDTTTTDQPPAPNGHGSTNGVTHGEVKQDASKEEAAKVAVSPRKTKAERRAEKKAAAAAAAAAVPAVNVETAPPTTESAPAAAAPEAPVTPPVVEAPVTPPVVEAPVAPPVVEAPVEAIRVRMKIWTHPQTGQRFLMTNSRWRDVDRNGQPLSDVMIAYALREDAAINVTLTASQWQALPFFYMQEDGPAPRPVR